LRTKNNQSFKTGKEGVKEKAETRNEKGNQKGERKDMEKNVRSEDRGWMQKEEKGRI
jgi:hypothetical protein